MAHVGKVQRDKGAHEPPAGIELARAQREPGRRRRGVMVVVQAFAAGDERERLQVRRRVRVRPLAEHVTDRVDRAREHHVEDRVHAGRDEPGRDPEAERPHRRRRGSRCRARARATRGRRTRGRGCRAGCRARTCAGSPRRPPRACRGRHCRVARARNPSCVGLCGSSGVSVAA